jgi:hypothetical protein
VREPGLREVAAPAISAKPFAHHDEQADQCFWHF